MFLAKFNLITKQLVSYRATSNFYRLDAKMTVIGD